MRGRVGAAGSAYTVRYEGAVSNQVGLAVRPLLDTAFLGSGQLGRPLALSLAWGRPGRPLALSARERPAGAGQLTVKVWRAGRLVASRTGATRLRISLSTGRATTYRVTVAVTPAQGYRSEE